MVGNICPRSTRAQYPQNPIQDGTSILPWTTPPNTAWSWLRNEAIEDLPLCVGEVSDANTLHSFIPKHVFYLARDPGFGNADRKHDLQGWQHVIPRCDEGPLRANSHGCGLI